MIRSVSCASVAANAHEALDDDHPTEEIIDVMAVDLEALAVITWAGRAVDSLTWILDVFGEFHLGYFGVELIEILLNLLNVLILRKSWGAR